MVKFPLHLLIITKKKSKKRQEKTRKTITNRNEMKIEKANTSNSSKKNTRIYAQMFVCTFTSKKKIRK